MSRIPPQAYYATLKIRVRMVSGQPSLRRISSPVSRSRYDLCGCGQSHSWRLTGVPGGTRTGNLRFRNPDQKSEGRIRYENDRFGGLDPYDDTRFSNLLISCRATLVLVRVRT